MAYELFDKRSSIYSDRTSTTMINDLVRTTRWNIGFQPYDGWWRRHRRLMHTSFHPKAVEAFHLIQVKHTRNLLRRLLHSPERYTRHIMHTAGAIIMRRMVSTFNLRMTLLGKCPKGPRYDNEIYIPVWVPGAEFQRKVASWRQVTKDMLELPFSETKRRMGQGNTELSFVSSNLSELDIRTTKDIDDEEIIKNTAMTIFIGGNDTTVHTIRAFVLAMALYPEVQKKPQQEIDDVLGLQRLPEVADMDTLPYVMGVCKESL
ncbi:hypothetical protein M422DRAFT_267282 [Sphaerobolus stellatus SS14]|uniref:Cytochrome P450 n=1 Tax=Sphaerobolus stellatus (strain SS14) TaxID=990650 RepID=A0A0C9TM81_SPHS4|nr:hypothetical protein M422DRAFT_267282 [Sphaerobolus stellatus SS14]